MNTEKKQQSYEISEAKRSPQGFPLEKYINASFPKTSISERNQIFLLVKTELLGKVSNKNIIQILNYLKSQEWHSRISLPQILTFQIQKIKKTLAEKQDIKNPKNLSGKQTLQVSHQSKILGNQKLSSDNQRLSSDNQRLSFANKVINIEAKTKSKEYQKTKEAYQKLNPSLKEHRPEEVEAKLKALSPVVRAKLKKNNIALGEYASFLLSREKIAKVGKSPETEEFLKSLKTMEKTLGIEEQTQWGYPLSYEPKAKVFDQNPDLAEFAKNDQTFSRLEYVEVFPKGDERDQKLIEKFGDRGLKELAGKVATLDAKQKQGGALSIQEKEMIKIYNWLAGIQKLITISKLNFSNKVTNLY